MVSTIDNIGKPPDRQIIIVKINLEPVTTKKAFVIGAFVLELRCGSKHIDSHVKSSF